VRSLIFSAEDSAEDTIVPRLIALGAQRGKIHIAGRVRQANEAGEIVRRAVSLNRDLPSIERLLDKHSDIRLLIIDPVSAYIGRVDSHKNSELRIEILDPLADLAERRGIAVVAISHFNKGSGTNSLERVAGSIAFPAAARCVWGIVRDAQDPDRRLMLFGKSNLGREVRGLAFRILPDADGRTTIQWCGEVSTKLDDALRYEADQQRDASSRKLDIAKSIVTSMLPAGTSRLYDEIEERARQMDISETTLRRACADLGVKKHRNGFSGPFVATIPGPVCPDR